jgi:hypothetical protein
MARLRILFNFGEMFEHFSNWRHLETLTVTVRNTIATTFEQNADD